ncbi:hypothetical protein RI367_005492 [Sorochytrium milnesiophthora]
MFKEKVASHRLHLQVANGPMLTRPESKSSRAQSPQPVYPRIVEGKLPRAADFTPALSPVLRVVRSDHESFPLQTPATTTLPDSVNNSNAVGMGGGSSPPGSPLSSTRLPPIPPRSLATKTPVNSLADLFEDTHTPSYSLTIINGYLLDSAPQFKTFAKTITENMRGNVATVLNTLEALCRQCQVPVLYVDPITLSAMCERMLPRTLTYATLAHIIQNRKEADRMLGRNIGPQGARDKYSRYLAACKVQATWRMYRCRRWFAVFYAKRQAARCILAYRRQAKARKQHQSAVQKSLKDHLDKCRLLRAQLVTDWGRAEVNKRQVIVHLPSFSPCDRIRYATKNIKRHQLKHVGRLISVLQPNTDVIFVTAQPNTDVIFVTAQPPESDELLKMAIEYIKASTRFPNAYTHIHIVYPECAALLTDMSSIAPALYASIQSMIKVKRLCEWSTAYVVPFVPGQFEYQVASAVNVPMLSLQMDDQTRLRCKTGSRQFLLDAGLEQLPAVPDIKTERQLAHALLDLLAKHPDVTTWTLKISDEAERRGVAYFETSKLEHAPQILRSAGPPGSPMRTRVKDDLAKELLKNVKNQLQLVLPEVYGSLDPYFTSFYKSGMIEVIRSLHVALTSLVRLGGLLEAFPVVKEDEVMVLPSLCFFLEPDGKFSLWCSHEKLWMAPFQAIATLVPQRQTPIFELIAHALTIAKRCVEQGIVGYVTLDFAVVMSADLQAVRQCWVVDLKPHITETCSMDAFCHIVIQAQVDFPVINVMVEGAAERYRAEMTKANIHRQTRFQRHHSRYGSASTASTSVISSPDEPSDQDALSETMKFPHQSGFLTTSFTHLRHKHLQYAGQAKWLDRKRVQLAEDRALVAHNWRVSDDARACILIHKLAHPHLVKLSAPVLNAMLRSTNNALDDQFRLGCVFLPVKDSSGEVCCLMSVNRTVTSALDTALTALGSVYKRSTSSLNAVRKCNFKLMVETLLAKLEGTAKIDKIDFHQHSGLEEDAPTSRESLTTPSVKEDSEEPDSFPDETLPEHGSGNEEDKDADYDPDEDDPSLLHNDPFLEFLKTLVSLSGDSEFTHVRYDDIEEQERRRKEDAAVLYREALLQQELQVFDSARRKFSEKAAQSMAEQEQMRREDLRIKTLQRDREHERIQRRKQARLALKQLSKDASAKAAPPPPEEEIQTPKGSLEHVEKKPFNPVEMQAWLAGPPGADGDSDGSDSSNDGEDLHRNTAADMARVSENKSNTAVKILHGMFSNIHNN